MYYDSSGQKTVSLTLWCTCRQTIRELKQKAHFNLGVRGQPGLHNETCVRAPRASTSKRASERASAWHLFSLADISQSFSGTVDVKHCCLKMSGEEEEGEITYINMESNTDDSSISDDGDELFSEDFSTDIQDTSSFEGLTLDSDLEDADDSFEESLPEIEDEYDDDNGADGDDEDEDDDESCEENLPENLKRYNTSSVALPLLTKRRRSSIPDSFMIHCGEPLTPEVQASQGQENPEGTVLQPVAEVKPEKLAPDADLEPGDGGAQETNTVITSSDQPEAPLVFQQPVDSIPANDPNDMIYPVIVGTENISPDMVTPYVYIPPNLEIPEITEIILTSDMIMNKPTFEGNQQDDPPVSHNFGIPVIPEADLVSSSETMKYPPAVGNNSGHQNLFSSTGPVPDSEIKEVILLEMPKKTKVIVDGSRQTVYGPALLGSVVPPDPETEAASISSETVIEKLVLVEVPIAPESIVDNSPETLTNPIILQHVGGQEPAAAPFVPSAIGEPEIIPHVVNYQDPVEQINEHGEPEIIPHVVNYQDPVEQINEHEDYLGDPRRNIRLAKFHLVTAKNKPTPTYAACYLANVIFSEEILPLSSDADHTSHGIFMDQNKMSAIREYLLTVFPNYDLREKGKAWKDCISAISFLIQSLYTEAEIPTNRNFSVPMSTNWCTRSSNDVGEGPSQWLQNIRESEKREAMDSEHIPGANPEGSDNAAINPDQMVYLGNPSRDIQIPYSVLKIAKSHLRPDLSAKYIILHLFPEEVLIESNVYGNMECGLFALDPNRIDALREFLQDNYSEYDLEETGYYWKLCVTAINGCLQTLRQGPRNAVA
ncbi:BEN domain-containing protein 2 [Mastomys coucha]|uniref:BEN domain-containing protein 2 n=1 Tax=Mastomys coucha TaxID=35658 RepID=UPI0012617D5B|nr:BEN domain-containing protein 2 [Mastomys coucha]